MKSIIRKGKALVAFITVFAILAVSLFTGVVATASATPCGGTIVEKWDKVSDGVTGDWYDSNFDGKGDGSKDNPYIITSAEEFAWVCSAVIPANTYYKVDENIKAFDMNTVSGVDLTVDNISADAVKELVADKVLGKVWHPNYSGCFAGNFDGSGVTIYGLYSGKAYYNQTAFETGSKAGCSYGGIFSKIDASTATFKNFSIKNSYFTGESSGAIFGETVLNDGSVIIENVVVANCYIESTRSDRIGGVLGGYLSFDSSINTASKAKVNNCLVYDNVVFNKGSSVAPRLFGTLEAYHDNGSGTKVRDPENFNVSNTIAIGCEIGNNGSYWMASDDFYYNCYTTGTNEYYGGVILTNVRTLANADAAKGAAALTNLNGLDKSVWFFNKTTYPVLREFHDFSIVDNGNGTHSESCGCGLESNATIHTFVTGICSGCGYVDPCINGHTLTSFDEIPATKTENGKKAHDYCSVCEKTFIDGVMVLESDLIIPMLVATSTYTGNVDTDLIGSGTSDNPFIITSADEFAAVALGKVSSVDSLGNKYFFKVSDGLHSLYINGGEDLAKMTDLEEVKTYLTSNTVNNWTSTGEFSGCFDGNGVTIYGVYSNNAQAGLFPKVSGKASIKNISIKNSYLITPENQVNYYSVGGIVGYSAWKSDSSQFGTIEIENCIVANNYIHSQSSDADYGRAGAVVGNVFSNSVAINNCGIYDNEVINGSSTKNYAPALVCYASGGNSSFKNIIAIGTNPYTAGGGWHLRDNSKFTNVYTDGAVTTAAGAPADYSTITQVTKEQVQGAVAKENIKNLDETIWFFNTKTYPQLRIFHEITADSVGVDGHENEKDVCCDDIVVNAEEIIPHTYIGNNCSVCDYRFPCAYGHNFTDVPAVDASYENAGNIAHKSCSQCGKKYPMDAAIDAPVSSAYADSDVIIPQMLSYDEWDGTLANYFWMNNEGDGSSANPFIIHSAEQLAAVAAGALKYDANKPTSENFDISKYTINNNILDTTALTFKVRDGLNYFYINGGEAVANLESAQEVKEWFEQNTANQWLGENIFNGTFNGNGAVIYGVYSSNNTVVGLFPFVDAKTSIKNVTLMNSYFKTSVGDHDSLAIGGLLGRGKWYADGSLFGTLSVRSCVVANNYFCSQNASASYGRVGIIAGNLYSNGIVIRDTLVYGNVAVNGSGIPEEYKAGLVAAAGSGSSAFKDVVAIDTPPYTAGGGWHLYDNSKFTDVYTDCAITIDDGATVNYTTITKIDKKDIIGDKAAETMPKLDWVQNWITNDGEYPTPRIVNIKEYSSGLPWTGEIAKEFPAGDGSKGNPYVVSSPEYLALMLESTNAGLYYKLTADIMINDTSDENWTENALEWFTSKDVDNFKGNLDGNGYTISGIFFSDIDSGVSAGLIPVADSATITNLTIADSYICGGAASSIGAVIGRVIDASAKPISLQGITVADSVVLESTGDAAMGGIIGKTGESIVRINNSITKAGGFVGVASSGVSIKNSISINAAPVTKANGAQFKNVYTNIEVEFDGVTVLALEGMKGDAAATNMSTLDFEKIWAIGPDGYPMLNGLIDTSNGIVGDVWSGSVASGYAGGDGSEENPYLIATGEQLARCVTNHAIGKHYKLIEDIYLNDIDSAYWDVKVGCNEWFTNRSSSWGLFRNNGSFDGDGHIVYGLFYDRSACDVDNSTGAYIGLFPTVGQTAHIKNVAISNAYVAGSLNYYSDSAAGKWFSDSAGALIGSMVRWDTSYKDELSDSNDECKKITKQPHIWDQMPIVENCLVDHTCYISGTYAGGLIGYGDEPYRLYDCIFTGSLKGLYIEHTGGIAGQDTANGAYYYRCVSLPQTCDRAYGGWANANWRSEGRMPTTVIDGYYFSKYSLKNQGTKIANPADRVGEAAKEAMNALDWENTWMVIEDGTPVQQIFAKHHTLEEVTELSDREFAAPYVTVSFMTDTNEVVIEDMIGRMYSPIELPTVSREGYTFTGWYVFDDCSIEYPLDYFPPRDLQLFAGWEPTGIVQNFESYSDTIFDYNVENWRLNKPGVKGGYKNSYVRNGAKSLHLLDTTIDYSDALINYTDMLKIGQKYKVMFWIATDNVNNPDTVVKLVHNNYPEYNKSNSGEEEMFTVKGLTVGEWTQYSYEFTARTPWVSLRAGGNSSLYFDDIIFSAIGDDVGYDSLVKYLDELEFPVDDMLNTNNNSNKGEDKDFDDIIFADDSDDVFDNDNDNNDNIINSDDSGVSPGTSDSFNTKALLVVIISCATILVTSKRRITEVIER